MKSRKSPRPTDSESRRKNGVVPGELLNGTQLAYARQLPKPNLVYVVDLFCGCGGMSWGFANTRQSHFAYRILGGIDINKTALATYMRNIGAPTVCKDIRSFAAEPKSLSAVLGAGPLENLRPLVFVGCPPCQGFSAHRKKDDRDDPRNDLAVAFATLCKHFLPES
jgi:DNA (cytosine-5)-methyltransferase 1